MLGERVAQSGADAVGDPSATRTVYITVVALAVLGLLLAALAVWLFKRTRPDPELLGPLEVMDGRTWRRTDPAARLRLLDEVRPAGAVPLQRASGVPSVDQEFAAQRPAVPFGDLEDDRVAEAQTGDAELDDVETDEATPDEIEPADEAVTEVADGEVVETVVDAVVEAADDGSDEATVEIARPEAVADEAAELAADEADDGGEADPASHEPDPGEPDED